MHIFIRWQFSYIYAMKKNALTNQGCNNQPSYIMQRDSQMFVAISVDFIAND